MIEALAEKTKFSSGEIGPVLHARQNLARNQSGLARLENAVVLMEGGLARRGGTRFQLPLRTQSQRGKQWTFRYTAGDTYVLVFNGGKMRVKRDGGYVLDGADPYEIDIPWAEADLPNLRAVSVGNVMFVVCAGHAPRTITRNDHDDWVLAEYQPTNGPVGDQNLDTAKTMRASAQIGAVTLTSGFNYFTAAHVGKPLRLDEVDLTFVPLWTVNETIALTFSNISYSGSSNFGNFNLLSGLAAMFDGNAGTVGRANPLTGEKVHAGKSLAAASAVARAQVTLDVGISWNTVWELRGKAGTAPASASVGDLLCELTVGAGVTSFNLVSNNALTSYNHIWITARHHNVYDGGGSFQIFIDVREVVFQNYSSSTAVLRRWQGRIYQVITAGNSGSNPPTHDEGDVLSGTGGVSWRYQSRDYGFVRITAVTDEQNATADVLLHLPLSVTQRDTYRWWPPAWTADEGFPDRIYLHDGRLLFARGNRLWLTRPSDLYSVEEIAGDPDSALAVALRSQDGSLPDIEWVLSGGGALVLGLRDSEWIGRPASLYEAITIDNFSLRPKKNEGSAAHVPAVVDGGALTIGRSKRRLHFVRFDDDTSSLDVVEITKAARHILKGKAQGIAFQRDPNRLAWIWCENGDLRGLTFDPEEKVLALHRHPMTNGYVEDVVCAPSADESVTEVHFIVRRTIAGETKRYSEILTDFFEPADDDAPTAEGAWFVDCGLRYQGAPATTFAVPHLIGQEVAIHADGAMRPRQIVPENGNVALPRAASDVVIGLPIAWKAVSLAFDLNTQAGSTKGDQKTVHHVVLDVVHAAGGYVRCNGGEKHMLHPTGGKKKGTPIALRTGTYVHGPIECEAATHAVIEVGGDDTMPFTLTGLSPELDVLETG